MIRRILARTVPQPARAAPTTLAQQKADFTAEGAPPPGRVANTVPVRPGAPLPTPPARGKSRP